MKIEQITALKDAGFTAEQIVALAPILTDEKTAQEPEKKQEQKPEQKPEQEPEQKPEKSPMEAMLSTMQEQFADMLKAVQGAMINGSRQAETEMTAADVAASILDPGRNRGKK
nr:MAG TPA: DNA binding protein [Caudoviricetes sp.]